MNKRNATRAGARANGAKKELLTETEIRALVMRICEDDPKRASALLVLLSDAYERQDQPLDRLFPFWVARQTAFSQVGNEAIDAHVQLLRSGLAA